MVNRIIWPASVQKQLYEAYNYILISSRQNAEKVKSELVASTKSLLKNPGLYPPDKYRKNNDGSFRAYELHSFRISYRVAENEIVIVRIRHTIPGERAKGMDEGNVTVDL